MLIIFDLDDTLIDTSGGVTPFKLKQCLKRLIDRGIDIGAPEAAEEKLLKLNQSTNRSAEALVEFVKDFHEKPSLLELLNEEMRAPLPKNFVVPTTPNAKEILENLKETHILALVTVGSRSFQIDKLEKAGIDRSIFSNIATLENSIKKPFYEGLIQEFSVPPENAIVCGDRVEVDLIPGHELGMQTVHMQWGRGKNIPKESWVDYQISNLSELKRIVQT